MSKCSPQVPRGTGSLARAQDTFDEADCREVTDYRQVLACPPARDKGRGLHREADLFTKEADEIRSAFSQNEITGVAQED